MKPLINLTVCVILAALVKSGVMFPSSVNVDIEASENDVNDFCPHNNPKRNERIAVKILREITAGKDISNMYQYLHKDFIQHNPSVADGIKGLTDAIMEHDGVLHGDPAFVNILLVTGVDNFVYVHSWEKGHDHDYLFVDIFRFQCGKVVQHWDVMQEMDPKGTFKSPHPFFSGYIV